MNNQYNKNIIINNLIESLKQFSHLLDEPNPEVPNTYKDVVSPGISIREPDLQCGCDTCHCHKEKTPEQESKGEAWNDGFIEDKISTTVREIFSEQLGVSKNDIKPTSILNDFGIDSLDAIELTMAIEEEFHMEIDDEAVEKYQDKTFYQMIEAIRIATGVVHERAVKFPINESFEKSYLDGLECGLADLKFGFGPQFIEGDQIGADSPTYAKYIEGYLNGIKP